MRIISAKDYEELSITAAGLIAVQVLLKPDTVLGLATGSSPVGTYQNLIKWHKDRALDFSRCSTVNLDEYVGLTKDDPQSYAYFMRTNLFDHINLPEARRNIPDGANPDAEKECERYDKVIQGLGGIDLQLLGIGRNGHIGFNEPGEIFVRNTNRVQLTQSTIEANKRFFDREEDVPRAAYTMGVGAILQAKKVVMIASGKDKAEAVKAAVKGPITPKVPASILQLHPDFVLVADRDALSGLEG